MERLNEYIDQTILRPDAAQDDILKFLEIVAKHRFYAAVVNPCWVPLVTARKPEGIKVCSVVGFPLGASTTQVKAHAAEDLICMGCDEVDMVVNIGRLKDGDFKYIGKEIRTVAQACQGRVLKVIIETCLLSEQEKVAATNIIKESGAHFVKTSTGFSKKGAESKDVKLLRSLVGDDFGVKASGGIRTYIQAVQFIDAGANRLGTSAGPEIMAGVKD
jgi:deoxyribose-phosphate aldolase